MPKIKWKIFTSKNPKPKKPTSKRKRGGKKRRSSYVSKKRAENAIKRANRKLKQFRDTFGKNSAKYEKALFDIAKTLDITPQTKSGNFSAGKNAKYIYGEKAIKMLEKLLDAFNTPQDIINVYKENFPFFDDFEDDATADYINMMDWVASHHDDIYTMALTYNFDMSLYDDALTNPETAKYLYDTYQEFSTGENTSDFSDLDGVPSYDSSGVQYD